MTVERFTAWDALWGSKPTPEQEKLEANIQANELDVATGMMMLLTIVLLGIAGYTWYTEQPESVFFLVAGVVFGVIAALMMRSSISRDAKLEQ